MIESKNICPICEEGQLHSRIGSNSIEYKGRRTRLDMHFSVCDACGSEQANAGEQLKNKRSIVKYRKKIDGLLVGSQVRDIRKKLGLSQAEAARVFGGGPVAFSKYENDDVSQSEAMDKLLRLSSEIPSASEFLFLTSGIELRKPELHGPTARIAESGKNAQKSYVVCEDTTNNLSISKQATISSCISNTGSVLGIDVGWSKRERTSAACRLNWDSNTIYWEISRFRAIEDERCEAILRITEEETLLSAAVDGPLRRGFDDIGKYRSCERLLSRGRLPKRIGKPGQSSSPHGKKLNRQANLSVKLLKKCEIGPSQEKICIDPLAIHEAFPTSFLGVMIDEPLPKSKSIDRSDQFFEQCIEGGQIDRLLKILLPDRYLIESPARIRNHDDRAAFVCAVTALCVVAQNFAAVGDNEDGWIILPPKRQFSEWAWNALSDNMLRDKHEGNGGKLIERTPD